PNETEEQEDARVWGAGLQDEDRGAEPKEEQPGQQPLQQEAREVAGGPDLARDVHPHQASATVDEVVEGRARRVAAHLFVDLAARGEETAVHRAQEIERPELAALDAEPDQEVVHDREARIGLADAPP